MSKLTKFKSNFKVGKVDRENNIIHGMTLIQANREALGHETYIDEKFVRSVVKQGKETGDVGLKARFDHPSACFSSMGTQIGRFKNFRMSGDKAVADLHLAPFAFDSNPNGNLGEFLMDAAENDPDIMGNSIVFSGKEPEMFKAGEDDDPEDIAFLYPHARLHKLYGCDVVDEGAATDGMFAIKGRPNYLAEQAELWLSEKQDMVKELLSPLVNELIDDNINQKSINMSDNKKSLLDRLKETVASYSSEEVVETPEIETPEVNEELEAKVAELASKDAEILSLTEGFEVKIAEYDSKVAESTELLSEAKKEIEALNAKISDLEKVSLGSVAEPVANTDESVELSEEAKEKRAELTRDEKIAAWAVAQANGKTATSEFLNIN
jgi:hypothetical protein